MRLLLPIVTAYLVYVVLGAVFVYVVLSRALRVDERAAMVDLDREIQDYLATWADLGAKRVDRGRRRKGPTTMRFRA